MIFAILGATALVLGLLYATIRNQWRKQQIAEILLLSVFLLPVGLGGLVGFIGHTLRATETAASIGWPAGNPFQYEVAVANLAFGTLGILCWRHRGGFWTATGVGWSIFLLGAAGVHLHQIRTGQLFAPGNAGAVLYFDIFMPVLVLALIHIRGAR
jgi:uncharacterized protein DUF6790